jgi:hypothetical protein
MSPHQPTDRAGSAGLLAGGGDLEAAIASRDAEQQSRRRQIVTQIIPASAFYRAKETGPRAGPAAAPISHVPALPQPSRSAEGLSPVPPAPGRTGRKPVGRGRRTPWQRSTFAAQTHQGRCTRYAVTDVEGRIPP